MNSLPWILYILGLLIINVPRSRSIDGRWTAWVTIDQGVCDDECNGTTTWKRYCTNPAPSEEGKRCSGPNTLYLALDCSWNKCTLRKYMGMDVGPILIIVIMLFIVFAGFAFSINATRTKKSTKAVRKPKANKVAMPQVVTEGSNGVILIVPRKSSSHQTQNDKPDFSTSPEKIIPKMSSSYQIQNDKPDFSTSPEKMVPRRHSMASSNHIQKDISGFLTTAKRIVQKRSSIHEIQDDNPGFSTSSERIVPRSSPKTLRHEIGKDNLAFNSSPELRR
ncbi:uncharacterized protein LOC121367497 [Gigantopelta aegis]|uniref:uncharacterized protein LOC121367497 n=1 Tax=Gigantopelta aegis TaxID=1735272 RepID=UPI001B8877E8|nr:uncharacterized protein LOC121367497 [Gigantopelta aegis]